MIDSYEPFLFSKLRVWRYNGHIKSANTGTPEMRELTELEELQGFYSDMFKDAYGFRPRGMTPDTVEEIRAELDDLQDEVDRILEEERQERKEAVASFEARVQEVIGIGAGDRETALRWIAEGSGYEILIPHDVEFFLYDCGIVHTDYGRALAKELETILFTEEELV